MKYQGENKPQVQVTLHKNPQLHSGDSSFTFCFRRAATKFRVVFFFGSVGMLQRDLRDLCDLCLGQLKHGSSMEWVQCPSFLLLCTVCCCISLSMDLTCTCSVFIQCTHYSHYCVHLSQDLDLQLQPLSSLCFVTRIKLHYDFSRTWKDTMFPSPVKRLEAVLVQTLTHSVVKCSCEWCVEKKINQTSSCSDDFGHVLIIWSFSFWWGEKRKRERTGTSFSIWLNFARHKKRSPSSDGSHVQRPFLDIACATRCLVTLLKYLAGGYYLAFIRITTVVQLQTSLFEATEVFCSQCFIFTAKAFFKKPPCVSCGFLFWLLLKLVVHRTKSLMTEDLQGGKNVYHLIWMYNKYFIYWQ